MVSPFIRLSEQKPDAKVWILGFGEQRGSGNVVDIIRLDRNEKGVHFNAVYVGRQEHVPQGSDRKKAAVYIKGATDAQFKDWAYRLRTTTNVDSLWTDWSNGQEVFA